jgi:hypothetical protein
MTRSMLIAATFLASAAAHAARLSSVQFLQTIGVNTHMPYTDGEYANVPMVIQDLQYIGVTAVRDGISDGYDPFTGQWNGSAPISTFQQLAAAHVKFTFLAVGGGPVTSDVLDTELSMMRQVATSTPGSVVGIEGPNEINNFPVTWQGAPDSTCPEELADAESLQKTLRADVRKIAAFADTRVVMLTGADAYMTQDSCQLANHPDIGRVPGYAYYDNQHPYPQNGSAPDYFVDPRNAVPNNTAPVVYTETGYSTNGGDWAGVNEYVQGMYGLDLFFDAARYGVVRTYWYDLLDAYAPGSPQGDDGYGMFDYLGNPKPLAVGLHNLHAIMADHGRQPLQFPGFKVTGGLPADGKTMELGRRDGSSGDFVVWAEPAIWNPANGTQVQPATETVTISLRRTYATVSVFDPTVGTAPIQTLSGAARVSVTLADHPLIIRAR